MIYKNKHLKKMFTTESTTVSMVFPSLSPNLLNFLALSKTGSSVGRRLTGITGSTFSCTEPPSITIGLDEEPD